MTVIYRLVRFNLNIYFMGKSVNIFSKIIKGLSILLEIFGVLKKSHSDNNKD